jgi:hypothetical protein
MMDTPATAARLARLLADLERDRTALFRRAEDVTRLAERVGTTSRQDDVIVLAVHVHGWYTALETLLERVAKLVDTAVPEGSSWHAELIAQMCVEVPGLRPRVVDPGLEVPLGEIRKFRHFFRNAYVLELDPNGVLRVARLVEQAHPKTAAGIQDLSAHVQGVLGHLSRE